MKILQPGDFVKNINTDYRGLVRPTRFGERGYVAVEYYDYIAHSMYTSHDLDSWEKVEILDTGEVGIKVDDLYIPQSTLSRWSQPQIDIIEDKILSRVAKALLGPSKEPQEFGAKVTTTSELGDKWRWLRVGTKWVLEGSDKLDSWYDVQRYGKVSLGWDEEDE